MSIKKISAATLLMSFSLFTYSSVADDVHWDYSGHDGPEHWGELDPSFSTCSTGKNQSPINLTEFIEGDLPELKVNYQAGGHEILNNGHTIQINYALGSTITVGNHSFELKQFHFHSPSENTIEGYSYPMEAHFVHADKDSNLAVIAVMFKVGEHSQELEKEWRLMPENTGEKQTIQPAVDANLLLPPNHDYYQFNGSLTTPPCSESVRWFVMKHYVTASKEQLEKFSQAIHHTNNRPIQPVNSRMIIQ
jgi:carbonic anhydrase